MRDEGSKVVPHDFPGDLWCFKSPLQLIHTGMCPQLSQTVFLSVLLSINGCQKVFPHPISPDGVIPIRSVSPEHMSGAPQKPHTHLPGPQPPPLTTRPSRWCGSSMAISSLMIKSVTCGRWSPRKCLWMLLVNLDETSCEETLWAKAHCEQCSLPLCNIVSKRCIFREKERTNTAMNYTFSRLIVKRVSVNDHTEYRL